MPETCSPEQLQTDQTFQPRYLRFLPNLALDKKNSAWWLFFYSKRLHLVEEAGKCANNFPLYSTVYPALKSYGKHHSQLFFSFFFCLEAEQGSAVRTPEFMLGYFSADLEDRQIACQCSHLAVHGKPSLISLIHMTHMLRKWLSEADTFYCISQFSQFSQSLHECPIMEI